MAPAPRPQLLPLSRCRRAEARCRGADARYHGVGPRCPGAGLGPVQLHSLCCQQHGQELIDDGVDF